MSPFPLGPNHGKSSRASSFLEFLASADVSDPRRNCSSSSPAAPPHPMRDAAIASVHVDSHISPWRSLLRRVERGGTESLTVAANNASRRGGGGGSAGGLRIRPPFSCLALSRLTSKQSRGGNKVFRGPDDPAVSCLVGTLLDAWHFVVPPVSLPVFLCAVC